MLRLNIDQTYAFLKLDIQELTMQMHTTEPQIQIDSEAAKVEIRQPNGELIIDQYPSRASYHLKNLQDRTRETTERAKQAVLEAIAQYAQEGDRLARIESGENAIVGIAKTHMAASLQPLEVKLTSVTPPEIRYIRHEPKISSIPGDFALTLRPGDVSFNLRRGTVHGTMDPYNSIRMWVTGDQVDTLA